MPGLKLNLSKTGVSLSAGVRGAHINLGPRGLYGSVGIPGTGLSYRQRLDGPARSFDRPSVERRLSPRQIEAQMRRQDQENQARAAQQAIDDEWAHYQDVLSFWKPLPEIPSLENFVQAQVKRPFEPDLAAPAEPIWMDEQSKFLNQLAHTVQSQLPFKWLPMFFAKKKAKALFPATWPGREVEIQKSYADSFAAYQERFNAAQSDWDIKETERVAWLQKLTTGDMHEIQHTLTEVFIGLHLPFKSETQCRIFLDKPDVTSMNLDLPILEEIIPAAQKQLLKNGKIREVLRERSEVNKDYFNLVTGECAFIAAEIFSYLPLCQTIRIAGYTQRPKAKESDPIDSYILDLQFSRDELKNWDVENTPMFSFLTRSGARFNLAPDFKLSAIEAPSWLNHDDVRKATTG